jgi:hypothetical protein
MANLENAFWAALKSELPDLRIACFCRAFSGSVFTIPIPFNEIMF